MTEEREGVVQVNLSFDGTPVSDHEVTLPPWHSHWNRLVYPLLVADTQDHLFPLGTAFCLSSLGHVLTATHNVEEAFKKHHPNANAFVRKGLEAARIMGEMKHLKLVTLNQGPNPRVNDVTLDVRPLRSIHVATPTDLLVGNILHAGMGPGPPYIQPRISFAPPRIGEIVRCVGYADMEVSEGGLSVNDIRHGRVNPYEAYRHRLTCITGKVTEIFVERFAKGFVEGPCFAIDAEVPHGVSGGPIFRQDGVVCGVVWSGATKFFGSPATLGSLLYPIFLLNLSWGVSLGGGKFNFTTSNRPVAELVATQAIQTDGAEEEQIHITPEDRDIRVGTACHPDDHAHIFENFDAFQRSESFTPLGPDPKRRGFKPNLDDPFVRKSRGLE